MGMKRKSKSMTKCQSILKDNPNSPGASRNAKYGPKFSLKPCLNCLHAPELDKTDLLGTDQSCTRWPVWYLKMWVSTSLPRIWRKNLILYNNNWAINIIWKKTFIYPAFACLTMFHGRNPISRDRRRIFISIRLNRLQNSNK